MGNEIRVDGLLMCKIDLRSDGSIGLEFKNGKRTGYIELEKFLNIIQELTNINI